MLNKACYRKVAVFFLSFCCSNLKIKMMQRCSLCVCVCLTATRGALQQGKDAN